MDKETFSSKTVFLRDSRNTPVPFDFHFDSETKTLEVYMENIQGAKRVRLLITSEIKDTMGYGLPKDFDLDISLQ